MVNRFVLRLCALAEILHPITKNDVLRPNAAEEERTSFFLFATASCLALKSTLKSYIMKCDTKKKKMFCCVKVPRTISWHTNYSNFSF